MLRTNTKKAIENIKNYIINNADFSNYGEDESKMSFDEICTFIIKTFYDEFYSWQRRYRNIQESFIEYLQGLPSVIDSCYYYNRSAKSDLMVILEETEAEAERFTEAEAERLLSCLLYREISKHSKFHF